MSQLTDLPGVFWPQLDNPHLTLNDIVPVIGELAAHPAIKVEIIGQSFLKQPIHSLTIGAGELKILAWTQMHGDEPTASAAVLDLLKTLTSADSPIELAEFMRRFTLKIIPILNPDGANAQTRINAQGIDINRDAVALQSPEGRLLKAVVKDFSPDIAFNLHDQSPYYTVANTSQTATIAFLAPAYDQSKSVNATRERAMQLIVGMQASISQFIPGHIARYNDDYSYRSFGDTIAGLGASTILIESGAHPEDPNRQVARHMNRVALLEALALLASNDYQQLTQSEYFAIPENNENGIGDILIRGASIRHPHDSEHFQADMILCRQKQHPRHGIIDAIGDLTHLYGFEEIDGSDYVLSQGEAFELTELLALTKDQYIRLLKRGFTHFSGDHRLLENNSGLPHLHVQVLDEHLLMPKKRGFLLLSKQGEHHIAILDNHVIWLI